MSANVHVLSGSGIYLMDFVKFDPGDGRQIFMFKQMLCAISPFVS